MDLLHAHDKDKRAEGARGFFTSFTLLLATAGVGVALLAGPTTVTTATSSDPTPSPQVAQLKRENADQAQQINRLRTLFTNCVNDGSCTPPTSSAPVTVSRPTVIERSDNDDNGDPVVIREETTKVVSPTVAPKPTPKPSPKPSQAEDVNRVKQTTDVVKDTVTGVLDNASKATSKGKKR